MEEGPDGVAESVYSFCAVPLPSPGDPPARAHADEDGDTVVKRRRLDPAVGGDVRVRHAIGTSLEDVGLQVWSSALLIADFLLQQADLVSGASIM